jgi:8-oxo-dGTP diphosphatase
MASGELIYCPVCGHTLGTKEEGGRLRQACSNCGYVHYVNPVPAVGILIEQDDGLVLIRRRNPPHRDEWTLPSGFIEADESAEDAAIREAEEETGLRVELVELFGVNSFPEGPPMSGIMIFFRARSVGGTLAAGDDASEARVFPAHELPLLPFRTHREAAAQWLARRGIALTGGAGNGQERAERGFVVRAAQADDWEQIGALLALIPANRDLPREAWRAVEQRFREVTALEIFVAETTHVPPLVIGFVALSVVHTLTEGIALINDMAVLPTFQRRGVGAALLEAAMRQAGRHDIHTLVVNVERANERVAAFYAAAGFQERKQLVLRIRS